MRFINKIGVASLVFYLGGLAIILLTNPQQLSPIILIVPFILLFLGLLLTLLFVYMLIQRRNSLNKKEILGAVLVAGLPVLLLLLQSIGQMSLRDILTLTLLLGISALYIKRVQFSR